MGVRLRVENSFAPGAGLASSPAVSSADSVVAASVDALGEFLEVVWLRRVELRIFLGGLPVRLLAGHGAFAVSVAPPESWMYWLTSWMNSGMVVVSRAATLFSIMSRKPLVRRLSRVSSFSSR